MRGLSIATAAACLWLHGPPLNLRGLFRQNIVVIAAYTPLVDWTPPQFFVASQVCTAPREGKLARGVLTQHSTQQAQRSS
jgi:hypothetical protein